MHVVVARPVGQLETDARLTTETPHVAQHAGIPVSFRIVLRRGHEALGIMGIVQHPVVDSPAGNAVMEHIAVLQQQRRRHRPAERESFHADFGRIYVREPLQVFSPRHKILQFHGIEPLVYLVEAGAAVMARGAVVDPHGDDAVLVKPGFRKARGTPSVTDDGRIRTAIQVYVDRIFPGRIKPLWKRHRARNFETVNRNRNQLRDRESPRIVLCSLHIA